MPSVIETILEQLQAVNEDLARNPGNKDLVKKREQLATRLAEVNQLANDKSKLLKD